MVPEKLETLKSLVEAKCSALIDSVYIANSEVTVVAGSTQSFELMNTLKNEESLKFGQLSDLAVVDYLTFGLADWKTNRASASGFSRASRKKDKSNNDERRYAVVYHLLSMNNNWRLRVKIYLNTGTPKVRSVNDIWPAANWFEREAFDLFGVMFEDHPDLRRILTDYGFVGYPFRKDFPLEGKVEVRYDPDKKRVVNEPVSIEPRTLVPRVIREEDWNHSVNSNDSNKADA